MKRIAIALILIVLGLAVITSYRAVTEYEEVQPAPLADIPQIALDEAAVTARFSDAIRIPTFSYDDRSRFDADAFLAFHRHLEESFPLVHQEAQKTIINAIPAPAP